MNKRIWQEDSFTVVMGPRLAGTTNNREVLGYKLFDGDKMIVEGANFSPLPHSNPFSDDNLYALIDWLSMDYTGSGLEEEDVTPELWAWGQTERAQELNFIQDMYFRPDGG